MSKLSALIAHRTTFITGRLSRSHIPFYSGLYGIVFCDHRTHGVQPLPSQAPVLHETKFLPIFLKYNARGVGSAHFWKFNHILIVIQDITFLNAYHTRDSGSNFCKGKHLSFTIHYFVVRLSTNIGSQHIPCNHIVNYPHVRLSTNFSCITCGTSMFFTAFYSASGCALRLN